VSARQSQQQAPSRGRRRTLLLALALLLPWVITIGTYIALESWFPGQVKTDDWRMVASLSFLAGGVCAVTLVMRGPKRLHLRLIGSAFALAGAVWLALVLQLRSTCGDEALYVGERRATQVASCE
jgi:hypothetical protein